MLNFTRAEHTSSFWSTLFDRTREVIALVTASPVQTRAGAISDLSHLVAALDLAVAFRNGSRVLQPMDFVPLLQDLVTVVAAVSQKLAPHSRDPLSAGSIESLANAVLSLLSTCIHVAYGAAQRRHSASSYKPRFNRFEHAAGAAALKRKRSAMTAAVAAEGGDDGDSEAEEQQAYVARAKLSRKEKRQKWRETKQALEESITGRGDEDDVAYREPSDNEEDAESEHEDDDGSHGMNAVDPVYGLMSLRPAELQQLQQQLMAQLAGVLQQLVMHPVPVSFLVRRVFTLPGSDAATSSGSRNQPSNQRVVLPPSQCIWVSKLLIR